MEAEHRLTLGEGGTPLRPLRRLQGRRGLFLKDEGVSPTGTFKARGMAVAVAMALQLGRRRLAVPSAGNAGVALAAYAAAAGLEALVLVPHDTPPRLLQEIAGRGARCVLVRGGLPAASAAAREASRRGYANLATLREPYRVEGKKTLGFEVWEQLGTVPDWVVFPTGGGTGIVGLWKAFRELGCLGWTDGRLPKLCAVQSTGCPPLARAWKSGSEEAAWEGPVETLASGLRVPRPPDAALVLRALRESQGMALAVPEAGLVRAARELGSREGVYPCYEGAAAYLGLRALLEAEAVGPDETVVLFNTGSGLVNPQGAPPALPILEAPGDLADLLGT